MRTEMFSLADPIIRQEEKEDLRQRREANYEKSSEDCLDSQFAAKLIIDDAQLFMPRGGTGVSAPRRTSPSGSGTTSTPSAIGGSGTPTGGESIFGGVGVGGGTSHLQHSHQHHQQPQQQYYLDHNNQHTFQPQHGRLPPSVSTSRPGGTNYAFGSGRR
ncbi:hypothetical protein BJ508DRAFT_76255 [Ascobolus immersus RN42]|uniref:Uncharacterized protein n=1 Tax=Ascobolus immersus RN42 TaxID=1160509 RepID=A0A3N4HDG4_ASCIM|nr:hypothetical protein BJ508DRAFT_76255 [Ascobolus immersus RN42]